MTDVETLAFILRVLRACDSFDGAGADSIWWRTDGEYAPVTFLVRCSDEFYWRTADCEALTPENVAAFEQAIVDCKVADSPGGEAYAPMLFCARVRKMRPMRGQMPTNPPALAALNVPPWPWRVRLELWICGTYGKLKRVLRGERGVFT
jgi:hypothetical protein